MAREMGPVLKRCRSLGIEPSVIGIDKKSNRTNARAGKKVSEYGMQLREKQKAKFIYGVLEKCTAEEITESYTEYCKGKSSNILVCS